MLGGDLRIGLVGLDTSHCVAFTRILNDRSSSEPPPVPGATVTHAWAAPARGKQAQTVGEYRKELVDKWGVTVVRRFTDLIGTVDAVLLLSVDGSVHLEQAKPFLAEGVPLFIDKPLANSVSGARKIVALAERSNAPVMSCSSLRYAEEVEDAVAGFAESGRPFGGVVSGPGTYRVGLPGLFFYGIHAAEMLITLFGTGVVSVRAQHSDAEDVVTVVYADGRSPVLRCVRGGPENFWFALSCPTGNRLVRVEKGTFYQRMLSRIVEMVRTGHSPLRFGETLEVIRLLEAANRSVERRGALVRLSAQ